jgi:hypothetical protein
MDKFYEERVRRLRERVLSNEKKKIQDNVDIEELTKDKIKEMLDKKGVDYKASDSKDQLLKLLKK